MPSRAPLQLPIVPTAPRVTCDRPPEPHPDEFARGAAVWDESVSRRQFLSLAGASLALAGVTGCSDRPDEPVVPYVDPPESVVAGEPQFFATTLTRQGYGRGVIVTCREGRPTKIEGNPDHPASLGAADAQMQAAVLGVYDPLRSKAVTFGGSPTTWGAFEKALVAQLATHTADDGAGLAILTGPVTSPTVAGLMAEVKAVYPKSTWHVHDPLPRNNVYTGVRMSTGTPGDVAYDLTDCDVIVSFGSDFLCDEPGSLAYARQFADGRRLNRATGMNRLYVAESDFSITGTKADHRLAVRPSRLCELMPALLTQMGVIKGPMPALLTQAEADWIAAAATDLNACHGRSVVVVGAMYDPIVHAMALTLNQALGNVGKAVRFVQPVLAGKIDVPVPLSLIAGSLEDGTIRTLLVPADNPVRTAPRGSSMGRLADAGRRAGVFTAHLGLHANETAFACQWHVPACHELETWGDARAYDGTASLGQPTIAAPTNAKSAIDVLNTLLGRRERSAYDTVRDHWHRTRRSAGASFDTWWTDALRRGVIDGTAAAPLTFKYPQRRHDPAKQTAGVEIVFRPDPAVLDGSLFQNPWLQELPRPLTKIVWGNAALISADTAHRFGLKDEDVVRLSANGDGEIAQAERKPVEIPVLVTSGVADDTFVLHLGYGAHRIVGGDPAWAESNVPYGKDVYPLRTDRSRDHAVNVTVERVGRIERIVRTHGHHALAADGGADPAVRRMLTPQVVATPATDEADLRLHNRKLIRTATLAQFAASPDFAAKMDDGEIKQLYPAWDYGTGPQWGMTIDLTACIGCNACVTACQAENNTPSVGADQVDKGREMHWLRIDQYVDGGGRVHHQPVPCMHCENAPCEYVCPVAATTHSVDGLNQMTYNRCVGTRYCSNNCPYKVRRFNFLNYTFYTPEQYKMQKNPDVTVRTRGVMEKCTYCVQRLVYADRKIEIAALNAGGDTAQFKHDLRGRVQTACQQTCPTRAIEFGDIAHAESPVAKLKKGPRNYGILVELSTKPRTTYLASVTNPSPAMAEGGGP